jgi:hypothetical protein
MNAFFSFTFFFQFLLLIFKFFWFGFGWSKRMRSTNLAIFKRFLFLILAFLFLNSAIYFLFCKKIFDPIEKGQHFQLKIDERGKIF